MENEPVAAAKKGLLTTLWFYLFAVLSTLLLSLTIGGIVYQLSEAMFDFDLTMSNAVRELVNDQLKFMVMLMGGIGISTFGLCVAVPLGVCGAIYLSCFAQRNWARQLLQSGVDTLTRLPAIIIGLFGFYFCVRFGMEWGMAMQSFIFALMLLPTIMNTANIALEAAARECGGASAWLEMRHKVMTLARPGIFYGIILALARVWCELIITLYAVTVALGLLGGDITKAHDFGDLFRIAAEAGIAGRTTMGKVVALLILVTVINAFINWLLKNFALREHWKTKQRAAQE
ncbi:MAG TPA: ABC transporter permease subunit [bacterium]|nr:ABC transporter permease subunit [bacterium]